MFMSFSNLPIPEEGLPQVQSVPLKHIHPDYLKTLRMTWLITFTILLAGVITLYVLVNELQNGFAIAIGMVAYLLVTCFTVIAGTRSFKRKKICSTGKRYFVQYRLAFPKPAYGAF